MKKILALALAAVMVMALVGSAMADGTGSVTISSPTDGDTGSTYSLWKLFDIVDVGGGVYVYTPVDAYKDSIISAVNTVVGADTLTIESTDYEIQTAVAGISVEATKKQFADTLYGLVAAIDNDGDIQIAAGSDSASATNAAVPIGYYLFAETTVGAYDGGAGVATRPMLYTVTTSGLTQTTKESYPTPEKTVTASEDGSVEDTDSATAQIGKDVTFQLKTTLPSNFADYNLGYYLQFYDTLSAGLKFKEVTSVTVDGNAAITEGDGAYVFNNPTWVDGSATTLTWTWANIKLDSHAAAGKDVIITYKATVTGDAVIGDAGNPNTLKIVFSNNPTSDGHGESKTIEVKVYAFAVNVNKTNDTGTGLAGAEFVLKKGDNFYKYTEGETDDLDTVTWVTTESDATVLVSNADGTMHLKTDTSETPAAVTFKGLPEGTYVLHETQAPEGYNLAPDVTVTITATAVDPGDTITVECDGATLNGTTYVATTDIIDRQGTTLPSTGGIGTTIFYVSGLIMVLGASIILISRRRADAE